MVYGVMYSVMLQREWGHGMYVEYKDVVNTPLEHGTCVAQVPINAEKV